MWEDRCAGVPLPVLLAVLLGLSVLLPFGFSAFPGALVALGAGLAAFFFGGSGAPLTGGLYLFVFMTTRTRPPEQMTSSTVGSSYASPSAFSNQKWFPRALSVVLVIRAKMRWC